MHKRNDKRVWVLTDERAGNRTQSIGLAQKLPYEFEEIRLEMSAFSKLPNSILGKSLHAYTVKTRQLLKHKLQDASPHLVIAAGRKLVPALRWLKHKNSTTFITYLMNPQTSYAHFDLVAVPAHDSPAKHAKIIETNGSLHDLTQENLTDAAQNWRSRFQHLPKPRIAVLVGGDSCSAKFQSRDFHELAEIASNLARNEGQKCEVNTTGSLLVTTSPRTHSEALNYLRLSLSVDHYLHQWSVEGENPYRAMLAMADAIIVTGDSMSMCAEVCSLGKPVFIYLPKYGKLAPKLSKFHESLFKSGYAIPLTEGLSFSTQTTAQTPLDEAGRVAGEIMRRMS